MAQRPVLILDVMGADLGVDEMLRGAAQACPAAPEPFTLLVSSAEPPQAMREAIAAHLAAPAARAGCIKQTPCKPSRSTQERVHI